MLEEIMLDKARIVRHAAMEWAGSSTNWLRIIDRKDVLYPDLEIVALEWLGSRQAKAMDMMEVDLIRSTKRYLNSWAQAILRRADKAAEPVDVADTEASGFEWDGMVDDLVQAENMARRKATQKNLTPWVPPRGVVTIEGELVDFTSHEFWSDMYLYAVGNPLKGGESRTAFRRRMADAGANAKHQSEKMPQAHNGTARSYSLSASSDQAVAAGADGQFDRQYQTINRPSSGNRRPMGLRDEHYEVRPVTVKRLGRGALDRRISAAGRWATEPTRG